MNCYFCNNQLTYLSIQDERVRYFCDRCYPVDNGSISKYLFERDFISDEVTFMHLAHEYDDKCIRMFSSKEMGQTIAIPHISAQAIYRGPVEWLPSKLEKIAKQLEHMMVFV